MAPTANSPSLSELILSIRLGNDAPETARNLPRQHGKNITYDTMLDRIRRIDTDTCSAGEEDAFFVADIGEVYRQHLRWKMNLKRVKPHYGTLG
jgi:ornithine decarboxylase